MPWPCWLTSGSEISWDMMSHCGATALIVVWSVDQWWIQVSSMVTKQAKNPSLQLQNCLKLLGMLPLWCASDPHSHISTPTSRQLSHIQNIVDNMANSIMGYDQVFGHYLSWNLPILKNHILHSIYFVVCGYSLNLTIPTGIHLWPWNDQSWALTPRSSLSSMMGRHRLIFPSSHCESVRPLWLEGGGNSLQLPVNFFHFPH